MGEINYPGFDENLPADHQHIDDWDDREEPEEPEEMDDDSDLEERKFNQN